MFNIVSQVITNTANVSKIDKLIKCFEIKKIKLKCKFYNSQILQLKYTDGKLSVNCFHKLGVCNNLNCV